MLRATWITYLDDASNYFEAGHRIRIEIWSSNFPRFDCNMNTGGNITAKPPG